MVNDTTFKKDKLLMSANPYILSSENHFDPIISKHCIRIFTKFKTHQNMKLEMYYYENMMSWINFDPIINHNIKIEIIISDMLHKTD